MEHEHGHEEGQERQTLVFTAVSGVLLIVGFAFGHLTRMERVETVLFALAIICGGAPIAPKAFKTRVTRLHQESPTC